MLQLVTSLLFIAYFEEKYNTAPLLLHSYYFPSHVTLLMELKKKSLSFVGLSAILY
jgi:hypothetical protein